VPSDLGTYHEGLERLGVIPSTGAGAEWNGTFTPEKWARRSSGPRSSRRARRASPRAPARQLPRRAPFFQAHLVGLCACCGVVYTIYAYGVYVCIRRGTQRERPQNGRNGHKTSAGAMRAQRAPTHRPHEAPQRGAHRRTRTNLK